MKADHFRFAVSLCLSFSLCLFVNLSQDATDALGQVISTGPGTGPPPLRTEGGLPGSSGIIKTIKTPPLNDGDSITIPIDVHNPNPTVIPNWAGVLMKMHVLDPNEVDVAAVTLASPPNIAPIGPAGPVPGPPGFKYPFSGGPVAVSPFGPPSGNAASSPVIFTALDANYPNSGLPLPPSGFHPVVDIDLVAKNTTPANNSDVDITLMFADIYHVPGSTITTTFVIPGGGPGSMTVTLSKTIPGSRFFTWFESGHAFVTSNINDVNDLHIAAANGPDFHLANSDNHSLPGAGPQTLPLIEVSNFYLDKLNPDPSTGHWIHTIPIRWHTVQQVITKTFHTAGGPGGTIITTQIFIPGSHLYAAPFLATATIGIEHVPEPAAPLLLLGGIASMAFGVRSRNRRRKIA